MKFDRRDLLRMLGGISLGTAAGLALPPRWAHGAWNVLRGPYLLAEIEPTVEVPIPMGKRQPFGWQTCGVPQPGDDQDDGPLLRFKQTDPDNRTPTHLRITVALDNREEKRVDAVLASSGRVVGTFDLRYSDFLQVQEIPLSASDARSALKEGVRLRMTRGTEPLWFFAGDSPDNTIHPGLLPHLLLPDQDPVEAAFLHRIATTASVDPFGWREGCVLDGLWALRSVLPGDTARRAIDRHLALFLMPDGKLRMEDHLSRPSDNRIFSIEATLPWAVIARIDPKHGQVDRAIDFWMSRKADDGLVGGNTATTEGCYTVAYPMLVVAAKRERDDLRKLAIKQLLLRRDRLFYNGSIYQKRTGTDRPTFRNWARGVAWYFLGLSRCLEVLGDDATDELREAWRDAAQLVEKHQTEAGLWYCFMDDDTSGIDTSGSAGVAAALALGANLGLAPAQAREQAERTRKALRGYLSTDGFLRGGAPSNKGGRGLQHGDYRVIMKTGMGLLGSLIAALKSAPPKNDA